jgi:hypothetical protein
MGHGGAIQAQGAASHIEPNLKRVTPEEKTFAYLFGPLPIVQGDRHRKTTKAGEVTIAR